MYRRRLLINISKKIESPDLPTLPEIEIILEYGYSDYNLFWILSSSDYLLDDIDFIVYVTIGYDFGENNYHYVDYDKHIIGTKGEILSDSAEINPLYLIMEVSIGLTPTSIETEHAKYILDCREM